MLDRGPIFAINHVLGPQPWARERLAPFAGRIVEFRLLPLPDLRLAITAEGLVAPAGAKAEPDLSINIKPGALPHLLMRDEAIMSHVDITGSADLAQVVQLLFRELQWDYEEDLSRVFGDVVAHRLAGAGRDLFAWQREAGLRTAQNFAEYWTEEQPLIARRDDLAGFSHAVDTLRDDIERLEKRIEILQRGNA
jgi:ubiquinone biosynthesis protein UbiJ